MWFFNKKKESKYKVDFDKIKTIDDVSVILKVFFEDRVFNQKAVDDFPEIIKYLKRISG